MGEDREFGTQSAVILRNMESRSGDGGNRNQHFSQSEMGGDEEAASGWDGSFCSFRLLTSLRRPGLD